LRELTASDQEPGATASYSNSAHPVMVGTPNQLRIGLMLRAIDDIDGQGIYIRKLCDALFELDAENQYIAYYNDSRQAGRYRNRVNVHEIVVSGKGKLFWDQVFVPLAARRDRLDVLFHHKFSIPLISPCSTVVQQRGTEYWMHPEFYGGLAGRIDQWYNRLMIPLYCRRAARVLTNSDHLGEELVRYVGVPRSKLRTVYAAADESFRRVTDTATLTHIRERYNLPDTPFLLMVVKGHQVAAQASRTALTPRKNVALALQSYSRLHRRVTPTEGQTIPPLVVLGLGIAGRLGPQALGEDLPPAALHTPGFVEFEHMPAIYSMARALIFPSRYESFGLPIVEAMACGCPVVTSTTAACPEVAGGAAILVDPDDVEGLSRAMERLSFDDALVDRLRQLGFRRATSFSWRESARSLLSELQQAAEAGQRSRSSD